MKFVSNKYNKLDISIFMIGSVEFLSEISVIAAMK